MTTPTDPCLATTEIESGEPVSPCHKPRGHQGNHEGWCLGSRCRWSDLPPAQSDENPAEKI